MVWAGLIDVSQGGGGIGRRCSMRCRRWSQKELNHVSVTYLHFLPLTVFTKSERIVNISKLLPISQIERVSYTILDSITVNSGLIRLTNREAQVYAPHTDHTP